MKKQSITSSSSSTVEEATSAQRVAPHFGGSAIESSQVLSVRGEKIVAGGSDNVDDQPRDGGQESVVVERRGECSAVCKWTIVQFSKVKARALWSKYFEVGGYDCRLLVYPKGDSQAIPGYLSIYLQVTDPRGSSSSKWDCFASYRLCVVNQRDDSKSILRDSWHRFSVKKKSHGWCDFTLSASILDPNNGFLVNESVLITTDILILKEAVELPPTAASDVLSGRFTWKVQNLSLFKEMIKTQKIMSPVFPAGECNLRLSVYQSSVSGVDYLSMCLESKDTEKSSVPQERSCWCLFRMSVQNQNAASSNIHRDSYGRFAGDNKSGDNTSLGWNDFMKMADFMAPESGYLVDDTATFCASFYVIKEGSTFTRTSSGIGSGRSGRKSDGFHGKFTWRIENFTKLKDLLKKRKITGLCIKSRRFQVGNRDCRLIVYPRGQSQPPGHLSMFLEVTDPRGNGADWSCFVSHRLSVVNRSEERSVSKESQNRYCKAAKDWGWREFISLANLFDQAGFLVQDTVTFSAEVLILKETSTLKELTTDAEGEHCAASSDAKALTRGTFTWKVENFLAFKEIMETRKIFSKFFQAGGCELRIGVYESFDTLCIYLESDQSAGTDPDRNFWVRYRMGVLNHKHSERTAWKESSICTKTWNNSVLQFMKVSEMVEPDAGFLSRDTIVFICEILDCCPWFEFSDLEVLVSDDEQDALSTDPDDLLDSDDSEGGDEEDIFRSLLSGAGFHLSYGDNPQLLLDPSQLQVNLREKLLMDAGAVAAFLTGLRVYLDDPSKVKRLLLPTKVSSTGASTGKQGSAKAEATSPSLMNLFMGVKVLQQEIVDLLLDIMAECCHRTTTASFKSENGHLNKADTGIKDNSSNDKDPAKAEFIQRLDDSGDGLGPQAVQSSDTLKLRAIPVPVHPDPSYSPNSQSTELRWPEQSEELLGLIVNSLRALDAAVSPACPEPRRRAKSAEKMALVLEKSPKHLQRDLIALVPKLVDSSEHSAATIALLNWLQKSDFDPALRLPVLKSLTQLQIGSEMWEQVLQQSLHILPDCDDESLAAAISCIFKSAAESRQSSRGVKAVRGKLKRLGPAVSHQVLDVVRNTVRNCPDAAEALLQDIDTDCERTGADEPPMVFGSSSPVQAAAQHYAAACCRVGDVDMLIEMLTVPSLRPEAQKVFERSIARCAFGEQAVAVVLERRRSQRLVDTRCGGICSPEEDEDFTALLGLAEILSRSKDTRVKEFVSTIYAIMFKVYGDGGYRERILRALVERATSSSSAPHEAQLGMDILTFIVREEDETARPVLNMMREAAELANADRSALWQQLQSTKEELAKVRSDKQNEITKLTKEKSSLAQKLSEAEALHSRVKLESRAELDRLSKEKREVSEQLRAAENQLEWARSEREEETAKAASEKKGLQDKLREAESQLSQLKARKRDDSKKAGKEKNVLAERLKSTEAACRKYDDELKRVASESAGRERRCQSLEEERKRLEQTIQQKDIAVREREQQISEYEECLAAARDTIDSKSREYQESMEQLHISLRDEMTKHAPLYGVHLDTLTSCEIDTVMKIHQDGLRMVMEEKMRRHNQLRAVQQNFASAYTSPPPPPPIGKNGTWYSRAS